MLAWYVALLALRRAEPELSDPRLDRVSVRYDASARWVVVTRGSLRVVCNLADEAQSVPVGGAVDGVLLSSVDGARAADSAVAAPAESVTIVRMAGS